MAQQTSVMREPSDTGVKRTRWSTVAVVAMFGLVGNMGSLTIGIITPKLVTSLGISVNDIGNMSTITGFLGIVIALAAGWAAAKWGSRIVGGVAIILGSIMNLVLPWSTGYGGFLANRIVYSMTSGTPPTTPIGNTELGAAVAPKQRGTAAAIFNFTFPVGAFILGLAGTLVVAGSSWRAWLWILGGVGVVVGIAWLILARGKPYERIAAGAKNALSWGSLMRSRTLWGTGIAWGLSAWSFLFLAEFLPLYYIDDRHSQYLGAGLDSTWTWVGGMIGGFFVGIISDALLSRTNNYRISRTFLAACSEVIFAGLLVWAALASNLTLVMVLLGVAEFFNEIAASIFQVISIDTLGERSARGTGLMCVLVNVFGGFSPYVTSHLFTAGLYTTAFLIAAATPLVGAVLLFWLVYPGDLRLWGAKRAKPVTS
jgi:predicted MFS family arabinose efflux permease